MAILPPLLLSVLVVGVARGQTAEPVEPGEVAFGQARALLEQGEGDEAAGAFLQYMEDFPTSEFCDAALFNAAFALEQSGQVRAATALYERFVVEYPNAVQWPSIAFRVAWRQAAVMDLAPAVQTLETLTRRFPESRDAPAAQYLAGFLCIGLQDQRGSAQAFENYAQQYPSQPDAESVMFLAGERWEKVGNNEAVNFYRRYLKRYPRQSPDHIIQAYYRLARLLEAQTKAREVEQAWDEVKTAWRQFSAVGGLGPRAREAIVAAELRDLDRAWAAFAAFKSSGNRGEDVLQLQGAKAEQLRAIEEECQRLVLTFTKKNADFFELASAAQYIHAASLLAYADMRSALPPPANTPTEVYHKALEALTLPLSQQAMEHAEASFELARQTRRWSLWQDRTLAALNARMPELYALPRPEERVVTTGGLLLDFSLLPMVF